MRAKKRRSYKATGDMPASSIAITRIIVDVRDTPKNRQWMKQFKQRWKVRLKQLDLWMVSYAIKVE